MHVPRHMHNDYAAILTDLQCHYCNLPMKYGNTTQFSMLIHRIKSTRVYACQVDVENSEIQICLVHVCYRASQICARFRTRCSALQSMFILVLDDVVDLRKTQCVRLCQSWPMKTVPVAGLSKMADARMAEVATVLEVGGGANIDAAGWKGAPHVLSVASQRRLALQRYYSAPGYHIDLSERNSGLTNINFHMPVWSRYEYFWIFSSSRLDSTVSKAATASLESSVRHLGPHF